MNISDLSDRPDIADYQEGQSPGRQIAGFEVDDFTNTIHKLLQVTQESLQIPAIFILDSSKLDTFQCCPRRSMFSHLLGWNFRTNHDLIFGQCIHNLIEFIHKRKYKHSLPYNHDYPACEKAFLKDYYSHDKLYYQDEYTSRTTNAIEPWDQKFAPKCLSNIQTFLNRYEEAYSEQDIFTGMRTEGGGFDWRDIARAPFSYYYNQDLVYKKDRKIYVMEHKTTSFKLEKWATMWDTKFQIAGYAFFAYQQYGAEFSGHIIMNGIKFGNPPRLKLNGEPYANSGPGTELLRTIVDYSGGINNLRLKSMMNTVHQNCISFQANYNQLMDEQFGSDSPPDVLSAFQRRDTGCMMYNRPCPYIDYCILPNPLKCLTPDKFTRTIWNPQLKESITP